jgi:hypothetical protein
MLYSGINGSYEGRVGGVLRSADGGMTWRRVALVGRTRSAPHSERRSDG